MCLSLVSQVCITKQKAVGATQETVAAPWVGKGLGLSSSGTLGEHRTAVGHTAPQWEHTVGHTAQHWGHTTVGTHNTAPPQAHRSSLQSFIHQADFFRLVSSNYPHEQSAGHSTGVTVPAPTTKMGWSHRTFFLAELSSHIPLLTISAFAVLRGDSGARPFCERQLKWKVFIDCTLNYTSNYTSSQP